MSRGQAAAESTAFLHIALKAEPDGLRVKWRLTGIRVQADEVLAHLPQSIAGAPTTELQETDLTAHDGLGLLPLVAADRCGEDGVLERVWAAQRPSAGAITIDYFARPNEAEPLAATPPLELRRERDGISGALKCFLVLPPGPEDLAFKLHWEPHHAATGTWMAVTSLGESTGGGVGIVGQGLERLEDTYVMCGDLRDRHLREGQISLWWLTPPGIDVAAFSARLGETYKVMAEAFDVRQRHFGSSSAHTLTAA